MMEIIPAIDLKGGKCVRLRQGKEEEATEYSADPVAVAAGWVEQGAKRLHVVNLDGAFGNASENGRIMQRIAVTAGVSVQFGGGLRTLEAMQDALDAGASRIVLGTIAVEQPEIVSAALARFGQDRVIIAIDAMDGKVATRGWKVRSAHSVMSVARTMKALGVEEVLYTDIARDGMMSGPDLRTVERLADEGMRVLASGGVSSAADVRALRDLRHANVTGAIIGKALYEGKIVLRDIIQE